MVSLECGQAAKGMFSILLVVYRLRLFFYYAPIEKPATQATGFCFFRHKKYRGRLLPYKRLMGMCRWMGSHFYDCIDYNGVALSIEFLEWGRTFSDFLGYDSSSYLRLANVPECLYCKWIVKCSSFNLKNRSIHKNRKWLSWDCENYTFAQK